MSLSGDSDSLQICGLTDYLRGVFFKYKKLFEGRRSSIIKDFKAGTTFLPTDVGSWYVICVKTNENLTRGGDNDSREVFLLRNQKSQDLRNIWKYHIFPISFKKISNPSFLTSSPEVIWCCLAIWNCSLCVMWAEMVVCCTIFKQVKGREIKCWDCWVFFKEMLFPGSVHSLRTSWSVATLETCGVQEIRHTRGFVMAKRWHYLLLMEQTALRWVKGWKSLIDR